MKRKIQLTGVVFAAVTILLAGCSSGSPAAGAGASSGGGASTAAGSGTSAAPPRALRR